jgi:hypothetical protein
MQIVSVRGFELHHMKGTLANVVQYSCDSSRHGKRSSGGSWRNRRWDRL